MKNNGVKNEHKINTCRRTDQLWLFPSLHFMIFVMPVMFGSIFLMSGYIAVMFLEQIGTAIICTALMFRHLFAMSGRREAVIIGVFHRLRQMCIRDRSFPCLSRDSGLSLQSRHSSSASPPFMGWWSDFFIQGDSCFWEKIFLSGTADAPDWNRESR